MQLCGVASSGTVTSGMKTDGFQELISSILLSTLVPDALARSDTRTEKMWGEMGIKRASKVALVPSVLLVAGYSPREQTSLAPSDFPCPRLLPLQFGSHSQLRRASPP